MSGYEDAIADANIVKNIILSALYEDGMITEAELDFAKRSYMISLGKTSSFFPSIFGKNKNEPLKLTVTRTIIPMSDPVEEVEQEDA